ncbi:DNA polymerase lambda-like [Lytechinus pictus]|uniref:DNA polymerase lambda-like n=1 Tax=Lytechinus pictus TaxID=7653 RepID=UPI0030B9B7D1
MATKKRNSEGDAYSSNDKRQKQNDSVGSSSGMFFGLKVFILQAGLGKARTDIFKKQLLKHGAAVKPAVNDQTTHVIVDEEMTFPRFCRIMKFEESRVPDRLKIVKAQWLSSCLSEAILIDLEEFILAPVRSEKFKLFTSREETPIKSDDAGSSDGKVELLQGSEMAGTSKGIPGTGSTNIISSPSKRPVAKGYDSDDSNYVPSDDEVGGRESGEEEERRVLPSDADSSSNASTPNTSPSKLPRGNWVCSRPSTAYKATHNEHITEKLEVLMKAYENTKDRWRALGYKKAISALKNYGKDVTTWEEASAIPGIGTKMADKILEIIESGHLRKIDHVCKGEDMEAIDLFNNVWGAGPTVAREWVQQGFRTLEDLREKAKLSKQQQIGLKHYHEFLERMPREEAGEIERTVRETAESLFPGMLAVVCGSYRRGKQTCGDVDVLITHPDGKSHKGALSKILDVLRQTGESTLCVSQRFLVLSSSNHLLWS